MTIASVKLHWTGTIGRRDLFRGPDYVSIYFVTTTDKLDQAQTILNYFEANIAARGEVYTFAGDTQTGPAYLRTLTATKLRDSQVHWEVVLAYSPDTDTSVGRNSSGVPVFDPLAFAPQIRIRTVQYQKPIEEATYISGLKVGGKAEDILPPFTVTAIVNSAFTPFDSAIEADDSRFTIEFERNFASYNGDDDALYMNSVNTQCFRIVKKLYKIDLTGGVAHYIEHGEYNRTVESLTAKVRDIQTTFERLNEIDFIKVIAIVDIDPNTWRFKVIDRGILAAARPGDPSGRGTYISEGASDDGDILPEGGPPVRREVDLEDRPIPGPVLFDGDGHALDTTMLGPMARVELVYSYYTELNFFLLPFFDGLISACSAPGT